MRGIVICKAGVGTLESLVAPAEGSELGVMVEVSNSYSESAFDGEVEVKGRTGGRLLAREGSGTYGGGCDWWGV